MPEFRSQVIQAYWKARSEHEERQRHDWKGVVSDENPAPLAAAEAALLAVRAQMAWQPIETAPKDGRQLLVYWPHTTGGCEWVISYFHTQIKAWQTHRLGRHETITPTHWLPLPPAPGSPSILDTALAALRQEEK